LEVAMSGVYVLCVLCFVFIYHYIYFISNIAFKKMEKKPIVFWALILVMQFVAVVFQAATVP
jgi:hypothetical protein